MAGNVWDWWVFISVIVLILALMLLIAGIFTAYFGSGKSRAIGAILLVLGLVIGIVYGWMAYKDISPISIDLSTVIWNMLMYIGGAIIGALIGIGIFLGAIMKA